MATRLPQVAAALTELAAMIGEPLVIVDVGAQTIDGEAHVYAGLERSGVPLRVIGFEPLADRARERRAQDMGATEIIEAFVGDGRTLIFHENNSSSTSSLLPLDAELCGGFMSLAGLRTERTYEVSTTPLDALLADLPAIDFLKLDIQGFELAALRGAAAVLSRTAMVQCEAEFAPIYAGQPLFSEIELHMRGAGFDFIDFHRPAYRAPVVPSRRVRNEQLLWADAVFATRAVVASDRALVAQAILALGLYGKLSVAERALAVFDRRHGTRLAGAVADLDRAA
jgi:FkbM family methyltransferase